MLPEATRAVLDMAAATCDDAAGAAKNLAQALADPAGEIESLKEKGIQLTEEQAENIKKVQEQNGVYEALNLLLQEVAGVYGGMAEAITFTDTGKFQQISNVWNDIKEGLGAGFLIQLVLLLIGFMKSFRTLSIIESRNISVSVRELTLSEVILRGMLIIPQKNYSLHLILISMTETDMSQEVQEQMPGLSSTSFKQNLNCRFDVNKAFLTIMDLVLRSAYELGIL